MQERFNILQGEGKQSNLDRITEIGWFTLGITKKSIKLGFGFAAEIGDILMYGSGQKGYARELRAREPGDRAERGLKTAQYALDKFAKVDEELKDREILTEAEEKKRNKLLELGRFSALDFAAANHELREIDPDTAIENTPAVVTLVEKIPDTHDGSRVAEQVVAHGLAAIVDDFNTRVRPIPIQRNPSD